MKLWECTKIWKGLYWMVTFAFRQENASIAMRAKTWILFGRVVTQHARFRRWLCRMLSVVLFVFAQQQSLTRHFVQTRTPYILFFHYLFGPIEMIILPLLFITLKEYNQQRRPCLFAVIYRINTCEGDFHSRFVIKR